MADGIIGGRDSYVGENSPNLALKLNAKASIANVDTLFHEQFYEVPSYQRNFSWRKQQVEELMSDLLEAYNLQSHHADESAPQYFLGAIVTQEKQFNDLGQIDVSDKIVDGQQRITSLMLLMAALIKHLAPYKNPHSDEETEHPDSGATEDRILEEFNTLRERIIRSKNGYETFLLNSKEYNYYLRQQINEKLQQFVQGRFVLPQRILGQPPFRSAAVQAFVTAFKTIETYLIEHLLDLDAVPQHLNQEQRLQLQDFSSWVRANVFVALIADTDPYDDQRIFDRMNTRGLPLSESDRFRSRVLSSAPGMSALASRGWQNNQNLCLTALNKAKQTGSLAVRDPREAERRILSGWIIATLLDTSDINQKTIKTAKAICLDPYDYYLDLHAKTDETEPNISAYELLKGKFFPHTRKIRDSYESVFSFKPRHAGWQHAQIMKLPFLDALIAACTAAPPTRQRQQRLRIVGQFLDIIALHKAWNRHWATTSKIDSLLLSAIHYIRTYQTGNLSQNLSELLGALPNIGSNNAPSLIPANRRWIRYFLGRLAFELEVQAPKNTPSQKHLNGTGNEAPEIEHIFSKRFNDDGVAFGFNLNQIESERQRLGALTLLTRAKNREASNNSWEKRCKIYETTNLLTRTLLQTSYNNRLQFLDNAPNLVPFEFSPWDRITPENITQRERSYAILARTIWAKERLLNPA